MSEITKVLIRILPFLVIIIVLNIRIKQKKISTSELAIQKPDSKKNILSGVSPSYYFA